MSKFQNKYRVESHRKPNWDYSAAAHYFITICCQKQKHYLGEIENHKMILFDYGKIVEREWHESFALRKELFLDEFISMPNHLHAIIIIDPAAIKIDPVQTHGRASQPSLENAKKTHGRASHPIMNDSEQTHTTVQRHGRASLPIDDSEKAHENAQAHATEKAHGRAPLRFIRKPKSISSFIAGFKSATTTKIDDFIDENPTATRPCGSTKKFNRNNKFWHSNYHDHIIRNEKAYQNIKKYIINNPAKWDDDKYH